MREGCESRINKLLIRATHPCLFFCSPLRLSSLWWLLLFVVVVVMGKGEVALGVGVGLGSAQLPCTIAMYFQSLLK